MSVTLVTGATGFIGQHVVRQLLQAGRRVRVYVRRQEAFEPDVWSRLDVVRGDLTDTKLLRSALKGVDTVLHLAALARAWSRDPHTFMAVNVDALARLLGECERRGVRRFVHVSSVAVVSAQRAVSERSRSLTPYEVSKLRGEHVVADYVARGGDAVIVRPTRVYGPGLLNEANAATRMLADYLAGRFRVRLADGDVLGNYVYVEDVAAGALLAERLALPGSVYFLGGENKSLRDLLDRAGRIAGVRHATVALPRSLALGIARAAELWGRLGGRPLITRGWVEFFLEDQRVDIDATRRDLGYHPRSLDDGLTRTIAWLRQTKGQVRHERNHRTARVATQA
jgi:farnesol dehydrogenase